MCLWHASKPSSDNDFRPPPIIVFNQLCAMSQHLFMQRWGNTRPRESLYYEFVSVTTQCSEFSVVYSLIRVKYAQDYS